MFFTGLIKKREPLEILVEYTYKCINCSHEWEELIRLTIPVGADEFVICKGVYRRSPVVGGGRINTDDWIIGFRRSSGKWDTDFELEPVARIVTHQCAPNKYGFAQLQNLTYSKEDEA